MNKTVLITGASSGFGKETAKLFHSKGWKVIATMRSPEKETELTQFKDVLVLPLDVQNYDSIQFGIKKGINHFGGIDVVINNAGYGQFGLFESLSREAIQTQFAVNVFGAMDVTRAVLPHFRNKKSGVIVNISSGAGAIGFPNASLYNSSKFALEGWSEGLRYELASIGIKVKIVEPGGAPQTGFLARVGGETNGLQLIEDYVPFLEKINAMYSSMARNSDVDAVEKVVATIYEAATDTTDRLRYTPTNDIQPLLNARRNSSEEAYNELTNGLFLTK